MMKRITVFCGASSGIDEKYAEHAAMLGSTLVRRGIVVVYGGAKIGIMGAVANGALAAGGSVTGVIPKFLMTKEVAHDALTEMIVVDTMHERKTRMNDLCDGVIALPGGYGTLEELFEMLTWAQLGLHQKPIGLLNINGYFDPLIAFISSMLEKGFISETNKKMVLSSSNAEELLQSMENYVAPDVPKWLTDEKV